ncbi:MAG: hypothetical protein ACE5Z5_12890 [Candidatus Bathyarchaeia archaeon]
MGWSTVRVPEGLKKEIEKFLESQQAKELGFVSIADFAGSALRDYLEKCKGARPRLEHLNTYENHVKIVDNQRNRIVTVYFKVDGGPWCDLDESDSCIHCEYAWTIPEVAKILHEHGFKSPEDKRAQERLVERMRSRGD